MISELPPGWALATLGELGEYVNGRAFKEAEWSDRGRVIIRIQDLTGSGKQPNRFEGEVDERHLVRRGDLLISWAATLGVYLWHGDEAVLNQHIFKVRSHIDQRFHFYLVKAILDDLMRQTHGSGMVHITKSKFEATAIRLPPLAEQLRIVAAIEEHLSRLDAAVAGLKRVQAQLPRYRAAVLKAAVSGGLTGVSTSDWPWKRLDEIGELQSGIQKQPSRAPKRNKFPFLRVANVGRGSLDLAEVHEIELFGSELDRLRLQKGDLLVVEGNGSASQIGRLAIWDGSIANCVHQNHLIRHRPHNSVLPEWVALFWNSPEGAAQVSSVASSTSGLYTLSVGKIGKIPIPVPSLEIQRLIIEEVERVLSDIDGIEREVTASLRASLALRQSVLVRAFSGQLVPPDPSDEPASVLLERIRTERAAKPAARGRRKQVAAAR